jgi:DNA-binding Lrp family transcriptional regulator
MATVLTERILEILQGCPYGLTANEVASRLDVSSSNISSRLSKLAAYGTIKRTHGRIAHNAPPCAIYHAPTAPQSGTIKRLQQR